MKEKKIVFAVLMLGIMLCFSSCNYRNQQIISDETDVSSAFEREQYPEYVEEIRFLYSNAIQKNNLSVTAYEIKSDESLDDESRHYSFSLEYKDETKGSYDLYPIRFFEYKGKVNREFDIEIADSCSNENTKKAITLTVLSLDPTLAYDEAVRKMEVIVNSFDGRHQSEVISVGNYKIYICPRFSDFLSYDTLEIISDAEINRQVNTNDYIDHTELDMNAKLNVGEKVYVEGIVLSDNEGRYSNELEVRANQKMIKIIYDKNSFVNGFNANQQYRFYGKILESQYGYDGCLVLEYHQ